MKTKQEFKEFCKKDIKVLLEIILSNIKKERSKLKELNHQDFFFGAGCCGLRRFAANRTIAAVVYGP